MNVDTYPYTAAMVASTLRLADRAVLVDIEAEGVRDIGHSKDRADFPVYDITSMFNEHEHSPVFIEMAQQGIAYGIARGLIELLSDPPLRVRVLRMPT